ncbi:hypothetical protein [Streptomyces sp. CA-253872]|uniref:hypothetical protein n=1 Tax=Streptomyces sp. CA-253872 TaxID=3240067 RepID=UPI003D91AAB6
MTTTPDADELRARQHLDQLGVSYAPEQPTPAAPGEEAPPGRAATAPAARTNRRRLRATPAMAGQSGEQQTPAIDEEGPGPAAVNEGPTPPARMGGGRLPDWRHSKPVLTKEGPLAARRADATDEEEPTPDTVDELAPEAQEEPAEDDGEDDEDVAGESKPTRTKERTRSRKPRRRPRFAAPGLPFTTDHKPERRSLIEAARSLPAHTVWLIYTGSALATGFFFGIPQWVHRSVGVLVTDHPTLTDAYSWQCWGLAAAVLFLDWRARAWALPLAWAARAISASTAVGFLLYGVSTPISQLL